MYMRRIFKITCFALLASGLMLVSSCRSKSHCNCPGFGHAQSHVALKSSHAL
jgi:hypothetical protein